MRLGSKLATIRPPSSGRMGSRLSSMRMIFTWMPAKLISSRGLVKLPAGRTSASFSSAAQPRAMARLESGPAAATQRMFCLGCFNAE
jgi:hypothetical protein